MKMPLFALSVLLFASLAAPSALAAPPSIPPLVGVCIEGVTHDGCYRGNWVCVTVSLQVPQCIAQPPITCTGKLCDPCTAIDCDGIEDTVSVCVAGTTDPTCYGYNDVCVEVSDMVPVCANPDLECTEACDPCMRLRCEAAETQSGPSYCMYYYYEIDTGAVRYVQRDSCHNEIYVNGERVK